MTKRQIRHVQEQLSIREKSLAMDEDRLAHDETLLILLERMIRGKHKGKLPKYWQEKLPSDRRTLEVRREHLNTRRRELAEDRASCAAHFFGGAAVPETF